MIHMSITRKRRGIYLTHWIEWTYGQEDHDAFSTLAEAKRALAESMGRKRLPWKEEHPGRYWTCEVAEEADDDV